MTRLGLLARRTVWRRSMRRLHRQPAAHRSGLLLQLETTMLDFLTETTTETQVEASLTLSSRIFLGRGIPTGGEATDREVDTFIASTIARLFPDGWTVTRTEGGWLDTQTGQTITEPSLVVEIAHGASDLPRVRALASHWKRAFQQQAVMIATVPASIVFI